MYIVIEIQTNEDGSVGNFVWKFDAQADAEAKWHSVLATAAKSSLPVHSCTILRNDGLQLASMYYEHKKPEAEDESN